MAPCECERNAEGKGAGWKDGEYLIVIENIEEVRVLNTRDISMNKERYKLSLDKYVMLDIC